MARFSREKSSASSKNRSIVRNRLKITSTATNAKAFLAVQRDCGTFDAYLWGMFDGTPRVNRWRSLKQLPPRTAESDALSRALLGRGFRFVGSTICYAFMQAIGYCQRSHGRLLSVDAESLRRGLEMFTATAELYDAIYSTFKDYPRESAHIAGLLRQANPRCRTVLDVAAGPASTPGRSRPRASSVDGEDLDPAFVRIASRKNPAGRFVQGDMSDFHLSHRYDAVPLPFQFDRLSPDPRSSRVARWPVSVSTWRPGGVTYRALVWT